MKTNTRGFQALCVFLLLMLQQAMAFGLGFLLNKEKRPGAWKP
jgi:hypothetical protein